ncbi:putative pathogenesis-related protein [Fulvia fulva]|uniref:Pathogenesis-related protein n=1 Tax=Passalora fulva TaxID=5499 RepID=A0A9Q8PG22_PASFU|nr:putative pathogenesis-related protein [Fulvia fulva]KAK4614941.1 putative pathogenesis-related protein [Fulvia fulva]UJO21828.1 putative pathogenesis-related protein [Fulvia fulva]
MYFTSLALAAFAVAAYALPVEEATNAAVLPPIHQNVARAAVPQKRQLPLPKESGDQSYAHYAVNHHNKHRQNHTFDGRPTQMIRWNLTAVRTARKVAELCIFAHKMDQDGGGYGQNLAAGYKASNISGTITDLWYNNEVAAYRNLYGQAQPSYDNFGAWGHFSQVVWDGSTQLGCYTADCSAKGLQNVGGSVPPYLTVCNYYPPGNFGGQYAKNVGKPAGGARLSWDWTP